MVIDAVLQDLNKLIQDVVDNSDVVLERKTTAQDVDDWDSLNHITFIVAIEKHFKIRFSSAEIRAWKNVGEMCDAVQNLLKVKENV